MSTHPLMLGVSGLRGTVGGSLSPMVVSRWASAFIAELKSTSSPRNGSHFVVVFGRDSRVSGPFVRDAAVSALMASGAKVIDLGVVTTPGTAIMVQHLNADAGMIATASHNPSQWNGIKLLDSRGIAPPPPIIERIIKRFHADDFDYASFDQLHTPQADSSTHAVHLQRVLSHVDLLGISSKRFKVVLDSVNGAGCVVTSTLLSKLGCQVVHLNGTPDGKFAHEPEPTAKNLTQLCDEVKRQKAHVGFAQDPDADRLAIVDEHGRYIGEEYSLALCAKYIFSKKPGAVAVANLSTSRMIDDLAKASGGRVVRSSVGEANVVETMLKENALIGGEGNGGVIDPRIVPGRDSLVGIAYMLQLLTSTSKTVSQLVEEIPGYTIIKDKFDCPRDKAMAAVEKIKQAFAGEQVDTQDGIRIDWQDEGSWVHARASNTEPIMRIIAEARDESTARKRIEMVRGVLDF